jgi:hypothetical protein
MYGMGESDQLALTVCLECGSITLGEIRTNSSMSWVVVPEHLHRRKVVTVQPREEYL